jgi:hypothetical protein
MYLKQKLIKHILLMMFYDKVRLNYENLQKELIGNEHLRHIYEPSARLLLNRAKAESKLPYFI